MSGVGIGILPFFKRGGERAQPTETKVVSFMSAASIPYDNTNYFSGKRRRTGKQLWWIIDDLYSNLKGRGSVNNTIDFISTKNMMYFHPAIGENATAQSLNLINTAQYQITWVNSWTFDSWGANPISSAYGKFGFSLASFTSNNFSFGRYDGQQIDGATNCSYGVYGAKAFGLLDVAPTSKRFMADTLSIVTNDFGFTLQSLSANGSAVKGFINGAEVVSSAGTSVTTGLTGVNYEMFINAGNNNAGSPNFNSSKTFMGDFGCNALTASEMLVLSNIFDAYQTALSRKPEVVVGYGDSLMKGNILADPTLAWFPTWCKENYYCFLNIGVSGTSLQNAIPVNIAGTPNFYDKRTTVKTYHAGTHKALVFSYGVNDNGFLSTGTYTNANLSSQLNTILTHINGTLGWPFNRIASVHGYLIFQNGWDSYPLLYTSVPTASNAANYATLCSVIEGICTTNGMPYSNQLAIMTATPSSVLADGIHASTVGNAAIKEQLNIDLAIIPPA